MLRVIHEYQIKAIDFVMLMFCYSKLRFDVLLIRAERRLLQNSLV